MEKYDYREAVREDIKDYINDHNIKVTSSNREELEQELNDTLFVEDSVTGNASGSYYCNAWKAEEALCHNLDLLGEALTEFGCEPNYITEKGVEACDVTIRCYLLGQVLGEVLDELQEDDDEDEEEDEQQDVSYGELVALEEEFNKQCKDKHIEWTDEEVRQEALNQFVTDYQNGDEDPQVLLNGYGYFEYPPVLTRQMEMFKDAKKISSDNAIFGSRKALLDKHFNEAPIYLDDSYYAHSDKWPLVERHEDDYKGSMWTKLSDWRDCHYYTLYEWQGHKFFVMSGGRYD